MKQLVYFVMVGFSFAALQVATVEAQDNMGVCEPVERIRNMKDTARHSDWEYGQELCAREGVNADVCATGWGEGRCIWGIPPDLGPLDEAQQACMTRAFSNETRAACKGIYR